MEAYVLKYQRESVFCIFLKWNCYPNALFRLYANLGPFKEGQIVLINLTTLDCRLSKECV